MHPDLILESLTDEQKAIVTSTSHYIRVIAGPGTGKTETLTRRILYLLSHHRIHPSSIVAFTFTEKAAQSLKSRLYTLALKFNFDPDIVNHLPELFAGTIHSFCFQLLQTHFNYGNYSALDENQEFAFVSRFYNEINLEKLFKEKYPSESLYKFQVIGNFIRTVNLVFDNLIPLNLIEKEDPLFYYSLSTYLKLLEEHRLITFSLMIYQAVNKILSNPDSISNIEYLFVDEYQDINPSQEKLIEIIAKRASLFIVGDPRQTIYQWRGSDEQCFHRFPEKFPDSTSYDLTINRRSTPKIINIANLFSSSSSHLKGYALIQPSPDHISDEGLTLKVIFDDPTEEATWIANTIQTYVNEFNGNYKDCAVLFRSVYLSASYLIDEFRSRKIPYIVAGKVGLFKRPEAKALALIFCWLSNTGFFNDETRRIRNNDLLENALELWNNYVITLHDKVIDKLELIKRKANESLFNDLTDLFNEVLSALNYKELDYNNPSHFVIKANIGRFGSILSDFEFPLRLAGNRVHFPSMLDYLCYFINYYATSSYEEPQPESFSQPNAVNILTIHQAKGLEWPIVFIPSLQEGIFPTSHIGNRPDFLLSLPSLDLSRYETSIKSEEQLFYVAITRPRNVLILSYYHHENKKPVKRSSLLNNITTYLDSIDKNQPIDLSSLIVKSTIQQDEIYSINVTDILDYLKCPYFFMFRHVLNYPSGFSFMLGYGESLHFCLHTACQYINKRGISPDIAIKDAIDKGFHLPFAQPEFKEKEKEKARELLLDFASHPDSKLDKTSKTEYKIETLFSLDTQPPYVMLTGTVDAIIDDNGIIEIRDYKTSPKVNPPELIATQLRLYAYIMQKHGFTISKASAIYLQPPDESKRFNPIDLSDEQISKTISDIKNTIKSIFSRHFPAKPENNHCPNCDYRKICKYSK